MASLNGMRGTSLGVPAPNSAMIECKDQTKAMQDEEDVPADKAKEILRQMRDDAQAKKHLDQQKIRAEAALRRAVEARDETAFVEALANLGIDPSIEAGKLHLHRFRQLPRNR